MKNAVKVLSLIIILTLLWDVSTAFGGSLMNGEFMFRKKSADQLAEVEAIVTSQAVAGQILAGQQEFDGAPTSTDPREIYLVVRVRALSSQSIWGDLECTVDQRSPIAITIPVPVAKIEDWVYYVLNIKSAGIKNPIVTVKWKHIYAK